MLVRGIARNYAMSNCEGLDDKEPDRSPEHRLHQSLQRDRDPMTQKQNEVALMLINYSIGGSLKWECLFGSSLSASVATRLACAITSAWEALSYR